MEKFIIFLSGLIVFSNMVKFMCKEDNNNKHTSQYHMNIFNFFFVIHCILSIIHFDDPLYITINSHYIFLFVISIIDSIIIYRLNIKHSDYDKKNDIFDWNQKERFK